MQLLKNITYSDTIKSLRDKKDYVISKYNVSSVKGHALFLPDNKNEEKYFYIVKQE